MYLKELPAGFLKFYFLAIQVQDKDGVYGVVLVSPSVTTFSHVNPSYRVYTMDPVTFQLLDYDQYYLNLTEANGKGIAPTYNYLLHACRITSCCPQVENVVQCKRRI